MLTRYTAWANDCLFEALCGLPAGEALKQRATLFGNMVHTMNHAYVVDLIWQAHLEGRPHGFTKRNTDVCPPLPQLREAQRQMDQWYILLTSEARQKRRLEPVVKPHLLSRYQMPPCYLSILRKAFPCQCGRLQ